MRTLDRSKPYSTTYGQDTATIPFFQNGLYYNHAGTLVDIPHNRARLQSLSIDPDLLFNPAPATSLPSAADPGVQNTPVEQTTPPAPAGADPTDPLAGKTDVQVFGIAQKMRAQLDVSEDADAYVPTLDNDAGNREFIKRHLSAE